MEHEVILAALFFLTALLYSSVGQAGYLAVMAPYPEVLTTGRRPIWSRSISRRMSLWQMHSPCLAFDRNGGRQ